MNNRKTEIIERTIRFIKYKLSETIERLEWETENDKHLGMMNLLKYEKKNIKIMLEELETIKN